jgi:hypothetical protein
MAILVLLALLCNYLSQKLGFQNRKVVPVESMESQRVNEYTTCTRVYVAKERKI